MGRKILPNFFIVGAARSGTTSLYEYLSQAHSIYMSPIKEPHFFAPNARSSQYSRVIRDWYEYLKLFDHVKNEIAIGEASPSYLWDHESPTFIQRTIPQARIIILLRDPIKRAFSHY